MSNHTIDMTTIEPVPEAVAMQKALEALESAEVDLYPRDVQPTNVVRNRIQFAAFVVRNHLKKQPPAHVNKLESEMTDRELLEAAAKAAGLNYEHMLHGYYTDPEFNEVVGWEPLTDDGDALRLAVKLGIGVLYAEFSGSAEARWDRGTHRLSEYGPDNPDAATRRAIVRAAAAMAVG